MTTVRVPGRLPNRVAARGTAIITAALLLAGCAGIIPRDGAAPRTGLPQPRTQPRTSPRTPPPAPDRAAQPVPTRPGTPLPAAAPAAAGAAASTAGPNALSAGIVAGPDGATLPIAPDSAARALGAFRASCPALQRRVDTSGLTQAGDWAEPCAVAATTADADAPTFFAHNFSTVQVGDGRGFATGYYEPEIRGSRTRAPGYDAPVYAVPPDLVEIDLGLFSPGLAGRKIRGRVDGAHVVPYYDRAQIDAGALAGRNLELAWAADPVELFFLQVQGSGRLRLPDGTVLRIGYAGQNGRDYVGIGRLLRDRGAIGPDEQSMQGIVAYLHRQPDGGAAIMRENPSWVFFRELTGAGPVGALNVPVTPRATVAADPAYVPLGAPVLLAMDRADANGLWVAQDTGGAIRGANRFDTFWGAGDDARATAGGMSARGAVLILLPRISVDRLTGAH